MKTRNEYIDDRNDSNLSVIETIKKIIKVFK